MIVSFQGERGAFSEEAALKFWEKTESLSTQPKKSFSDVFSSVSDGESDFGILPIENSLTGSIHQNMDLFLKHDLFITGEYILRIEHHLMACKSNSIHEIREIMSHPQGLMQCSEYFESLDNVELRAVYDTAGSAKLVAEKKKPELAAVASIQAAEEYGLKILKKNVENNRLNYTRFVIISKKQNTAQGSKTSIIFSAKDVPGALFKCLAVFSFRDINLLKIESRPIVGKPWNYLFYLDFEGDINDKKSRNALQHLEELTEFIKFLGSY
ncbi:prephenate dehydratase [bacterium]|nr:prephenate dehydratase [bacterium]